MPSHIHIDDCQRYIDIPLHLLTFCTWNSLDLKLEFNICSFWCKLSIHRKWNENCIILRLLATYQCRVTIMAVVFHPFEWASGSVHILNYIVKKGKPLNHRNHYKSFFNECVSPNSKQKVSFSQIELINNVRNLETILIGKPHLAHSNSHQWTIEGHNPNNVDGRIKRKH